MRRGNCDPVMLMDLPAVENGGDPLGLCGLYGAYRVGVGSVLIGRFQHIAVLPDGSGVVIEVTNDHAVPAFQSYAPEPPEEGIFFVRADGKERRRLGDQTALPIITVGASANGVPFIGEDNVAFTRSPDGRLIAFPDNGPGPDGEDAPQIFTLDVQTGRRRQLTHLPPAPPDAARVGFPFFTNDGRAITFTYGAHGLDGVVVRVDGGGLEPVPAVDAPPGATVLSQFGVVGGGSAILLYALQGEPKKTYFPGDSITELFVTFGKRILQLTSFGFPDTGFHSTLGAARAFIAASADPLGRNPQGMCQIFSITPLGSDLRQLTHFPDDGGMKSGCNAGAPGVACNLQALVQDPVTQFVMFRSQCDPAGRNPNGEQLFGMRPDGSGLRQLTSFRGVEQLPDGGIRVELAGPLATTGTTR